MLEFFNLQNWSDLCHEDGFGSLILILCMVSVVLPALLFSDRIQSWRSARQEKAKWRSFQRN